MSQTQYEFESYRIILIHDMEYIASIATIWKWKIRKTMYFIHFSINYAFKSETQIQIESRILTKFDSI